MKVYGERNSGTNLVEAMLLGSHAVRVLPGTSPGWVKWCAWRVPGRREAVLDAWDRVTRARTLGWKHCYVDDATAERIGRRGVVALAVTKHPLSWLVSLRRTAYHTGPGPHGDDVVDLPLHRRHLPTATTDPLEVWQAKTARYLELRRRGVLRVVRFEDLVLDPGVVLARDGLGGLVPADALRPPGSSVKRDERTAEQIRAEYVGEEWRRRLRDGDVERAARLDGTLLRELGYEIPEHAG